MFCLPHLVTSAAVFIICSPPLLPPPPFPPVSPLFSPLLPLLFTHYSWKSWENECISFCLWRLGDPTGLKVPFSVSVIEGGLQTLLPAHLEPDHPFHGGAHCLWWAMWVHTVHTELDLCQSCFLVFTQGTWVPQWGLRGSMHLGL